MPDNSEAVPGLIIAALKGGSGKTVISLGIIAALRKQGKVVAPFKKGPDYIDSGWLSLTAGRPCYNLDTYLVKNNRTIHSYTNHSKHCDIAVIEGNRGLYDGIDTDGSTSTAELSKVLKVPVVLCVDCTKSTRTIAAVVKGCEVFDPKVRILGVILNNLAGSRHENKIRTNIERFCDVPVVGAIPRFRKSKFPERHMGLIPTQEHDWANDSIDSAAEIAETYIDLPQIIQIANSADIIPGNNSPGSTPKPLKSGTKPKIAVIRDSAFQFYYPDNLDALRHEGAELIFTSPFTDSHFPEVDGVYIGGGFPETHPDILSDNVTYRNSLKELAENDLPVYAECGGLMYMGETLHLDGKSYSMTGILPLSFGVSKKPQGHGYTEVIITRDNSWYKKGQVIRGHEFRYSKIIDFRADENELVFQMKRGTGMLNKKDGFIYKQVFATYNHIHSDGTPEWARSMIRNALVYKNKIA